LIRYEKAFGEIIIKYSSAENNLALHVPEEISRSGRELYVVEVQRTAGVSIEQQCPIQSTAVKPDMVELNAASSTVAEIY